MPKTEINIEFRETQNRQELSSGDEIKTLFGKLKKWLSDLKPVAFSGSYSDLSDIPEQMAYSAENGVQISESGVISHTNSFPAKDIGRNETTKVINLGEMFSLPWISADEQGHITTSGQSFYTLLPPNIATAESDGLMSAADKAKLDAFSSVEYGMDDLESGVSSLENGKIYLVYE